MHCALRTLERDGLITRTAYPVIPPRVEYELTPLGMTLRDPLSAIREWAETHVHEIVRARLAFDAERAHGEVASAEQRELERRAGA